MKKVSWELIISILAGLIGVVCLILLVFMINKLITESVTNTRIWGVVGLSVGFVVCFALVGVMFTLYKAKKNPDQIINKDDKNNE